MYLKCFCHIPLLYETAIPATCSSSEGLKLVCHVHTIQFWLHQCLAQSILIKNPKRKRLSNHHLLFSTKDVDFLKNIFGMTRISWILFWTVGYKHYLQWQTHLAWLGNWTETCNCKNFIFILHYFYSSCPFVKLKWLQNSNNLSNNIIFA